MLQPSTHYEVTRGSSCRHMMGHGSWAGAGQMDSDECNSLDVENCYSGRFSALYAAPSGDAITPCAPCSTTTGSLHAAMNLCSYADSIPALTGCAAELELPVLSALQQPHQHQQLRFPVCDRANLPALCYDMHSQRAMGQSPAWSDVVEQTFPGSPGLAGHFVNSPLAALNCGPAPSATAPAPATNGVGSHQALASAPNSETSETTHLLQLTQLSQQQQQLRRTLNDLREASQDAHGAASPKLRRTNSGTMAMSAAQPPPVMPWTPASATAATAAAVAAAGMCSGHDAVYPVHGFTPGGYPGLQRLVDEELYDPQGCGMGSTSYNPGAGYHHPGGVNNNKNRDAQRRFRQRQREAFSTLQARVREQELQLHALHREKRMVEQHNELLLKQLRKYEEEKREREQRPPQQAPADEEAYRTHLCCLCSSAVFQPHQELLSN